MRVLLRRLDAGPDRVIEQPEAATEPAQITGPNQRRRQTTAHLFRRCRGGRPECRGW